MKALTLTQPWATLVAIGAKRIETRSWSTNYRGPLAIHAAKKFPADAMRLCTTEPFYSALRSGGAFNPFPPVGVILAICELIECVEITRYPQRVTRRYMKTEIGEDGYLEHNFYAEDLDIFIPPPEPERSFGDYTPGRYAWILTNIKPLPAPIPAKGALGLWDWEPVGVEL